VGEVNWVAAVAEAQQFLSPAQFDVVRAYAAHAQANQRMMQSAEAARRSLGGAGEGILVRKQPGS
jgi:hypothetical protein